MSSKYGRRIQSEASECGLACLAVCSALLGAELEMNELRQKFYTSQRGLELGQLIALAGALHLQCRPVRCELEELRDLSLPAILHWKLNHFVVLEKVRRGRFHIIDPAHGSLTMSAEELSRSFSGVALEVSTAPGFERRKTRSPLNIWSLIRFRNGVGGALCAALVFSVLLQVFILISPLFMQLAMDEVVVRGDQKFLVVLALGFAGVTIFNAAAEVIRSATLQRASELMGWDMSRRLFHHMMTLPLTWFHRRRLADALSRLESIDPIRRLIASGLIGAILDGILGVGVLIFMLSYSPKMTLVALAFIGFYVMVKVATVPTAMKLGMESIQAGVSERGTRIETLRAMQTIKTMGGEASREALWANKYADQVRASIRNGYFQIGLGSSRSLAEGLSFVLIVYMGVSAILSGELTVGGVYAFIAYRQQLSNRVSALVEQCIAWRVTELHTDRISDIALSESEEGLDKDPATAVNVRGEIEMKLVSFRYGAREQSILEDISIHIRPGEFVAITGPSGCGKSTLVKVITGLYPPTSGEVLYDGVSLSNWGPRVIRQRIGIVMQDDDLLTGSILENVTFFADSPDVDFVWKCLDMAAMKGDVHRMPMQLETQVGDMGSSLSGGQKQRLLLARALYRKPLILILDEATANVDVSRESAIHRELAQLDITRIVITHRPETMKLADRLIRLDQGRIADDLNNKVDGLLSGRGDPVEPCGTTLA
ncbi:peptidase domain-containing ABC transporter [Stenotrophomonas sp. TWI1149]|uniref:peptidase domain-containing ABC transporter n=1 Tax=unclassified Stenotrophomonas TaxID=196198 RepID=UPI0032082605